MDQLERHGYGWCRYCNMVQPPRAKHCRDCNSCVLRNDHHCPFVNNCIGQRNYAVFCGFLLSVSGLAISEASGFFLCWLASSGTGPILVSQCVSLSPRCWGSLSLCSLCASWGCACFTPPWWFAVEPRERC